MIGVFIFPDFQLLDAAGPISVFEMAGRLAGRRIPIRTMAVTPGEVHSSSGVAMAARAARVSADLTTLLVVGGQGVETAAQCRKTQDFVRGAARRGCRVASVCSGSYILAEAGLLDGRRATTHWRRSPDFLARYPQVRLEPDRIYVRDGDIWSSAGISAGIDLALAMVAADSGEKLAREVARQLVVYFQRPGGQSQFSTLLELTAPAGRFKALLGWARENLHHNLTVEVLADQAGMSARHFARTFIAETGATPAKAIERLRLEVARDRIRATGEPIEAVARAIGFSDPERMRRAFIRTFGHPPQALRRIARAA